MTALTPSPELSEFPIGDKAIDIRQHAVDRWQERVSPATTRAQAYAEVREFAAMARLRGRGPKWLHIRTGRGGARFLTCSERPDIALVVVASSSDPTRLAIITVHTRATAGHIARPKTPKPIRPHRRTR